MVAPLPLSVAMAKNSHNWSLREKPRTEGSDPVWGLGSRHHKRCAESPPPEIITHQRETQLGPRQDHQGEDGNYSTHLEMKSIDAFSEYRAESTKKP